MEIPVKYFELSEFDCTFTGNNEMKPEFLEKFMEEHGFIGCVCASAKTGVGVTEAVASLVRQVLI